MRVLYEDSIYECLRVSREEFPLHGKKKECHGVMTLCIMGLAAMDISLAMIKVTAYTKEENENLVKTFDLMLKEGYIDLNDMRHISIA